MKKLLFLQLPRLDPDVTTPGENAMLAGECLTAAIRRSPEAAHCSNLPTPPNQDTADDEALLASVAAAAPDVASFTCYLWNIERSLHLAERLRRLLPELCVLMGGPEIAVRHPLLPADLPFCTPADGTSKLPPRKPGPITLGCIGEGEPYYADALRYIRTGRRSAPDPAAVPSFALAQSGKTGVLETVRGCPMHCAFCCYNMRRPRPAALEPREVAMRVRAFRRAGVNEIRVIDPTFNAHPQFDSVLGAIRRANPGGKIALFVEVRADTLTEKRVAAMAAAGVAEAEVGIQSTDPAVLRLLHRPLDFSKIKAGIALLLKHHIRPTVDFMYGLPAQGRDDLERSLGTLADFGEAVYPQFLPTLLLPGTELRDRARELRLRAQPRPPWRVTQTDRLRVADLAAIEDEATHRLGAFDTPTRRFVGSRLPDLFARPDSAPADASRQLRAFDFSDAAFPAIRSAIRAAVRREPHILWQFVLRTREEFPLDFLDALIADFRRQPAHWLDRLLSPPGTRQLAARRLFIQFPRGASIDPAWVADAEDLLRSVFH